MLRILSLIALRKLAKEKLYITINIISLAIGIGSFIILSLYLRSELTYDQHYSNHERIYRVSTHFRQSNGSVANYALSAEGIGPLLVADNRKRQGKHT